LCANDAPNEIAFDIKLSELFKNRSTDTPMKRRSDTYVAADNLIVLGIFNNLQNFSDGTVDFVTRATDKNDVFSRRVTGGCT